MQCLWSHWFLFRHHNDKYSFLQEATPHAVLHRQNNDDLILAIQSAGVERGRNGFRKDKSMEKQPESEEDLLEHRTDGTDAFGTLYIGCEKFPQHDLYPICDWWSAIIAHFCRK